jgi:hypothetical protein
MEYINEINPNYIKSNNYLNPQTENLIKDQLIKENPQLANNLRQLRQEVLKRVNKIINVDSNYFLG